MSDPHPHEFGSQSGGGVAAVLEGEHTYGSVNKKLSDVVLERPFQKGWIVGFLVAFTLLNVFMVAVAYLLFKGTGIWGIQNPVMWGFAIVNFVWWIGIGHAGTLISAILLLLKQDWRTSINRFAEAMTLFAVACAGAFPLLHMGRPWVFYWLLPYPNTMGMWPQWRSPLVWDVFAVTTYLTVSLLFWYVGLIPDLATLRDKARNGLARVAYGATALGWRGSARHWHRYKTAYLLLAGLSTPLVVSVHTVVSFDFTIGIIPGWHSTIFPPYFVAGAIYSGFAMVATLMLPLRWYYDLRDYITERHINNMAKIMLATGLMVTYGYVMELFIAWYGGNPYEMSQMLETRPSTITWQLLILCNCSVVQLFWFPYFRKNVYWVWVISIIINVGMWLERYVIVVTSLSADFLPSSWGAFTPTAWDIATYVGTIGLFLSMIFIFIRILPALSITEMKEMVHEQHAHHGGSNNGHAPKNNQAGLEGGTSS